MVLLCIKRGRGTQRSTNCYLKGSCYAVLFVGTAKHTATNANIKKTRASYYSDSTSDTDLLFRISEKSAFHNDRLR
jgi:hypothetical protein